MNFKCAVNYVHRGNLGIFREKNFKDVEHFFRIEDFVLLRKTWIFNQII